MKLKTVLLVSIALRVALIAWGELQDRLLDVKYTGAWLFVYSKDRYSSWAHTHSHPCHMCIFAASLLLLVTSQTSTMSCSQTLHATWLRGSPPSCAAHTATHHCWPTCCCPTFG